MQLERSNNPRQNENGTWGLMISTCLVSEWWYCSGPQTTMKLEEWMRILFLQENPLLSWMTVLVTCFWNVSSVPSPQMPTYLVASSSSQSMWTSHAWILQITQQTQFLKCVCTKYTLTLSWQYLLFNIVWQLFSHLCCIRCSKSLRIGQSIQATERCV